LYKIGDICEILIFFFVISELKLSMIFAPQCREEFGVMDLLGFGE
jgi:hypothetical protein